MTDRDYGEVTFFMGRYGFIKPDRAEPDVFFHVSELPEGQDVQRGDRVSYEIGANRQPGRPARTCARQVRLG
jgi:cold shock CspA family protein